jgi:hypothetical protein
MSLKQDVDLVMNEGRLDIDVVEPPTEEIRLLRSIRCYVAWAFWLAVIPGIVVLIAMLPTLFGSRW